MAGGAARGGSAVGYAGDLQPVEAWRVIEAERAARLVDVRTSAEWAYVGVPDLTPLGKKADLISWQVYPAMSVSPSFEQDLTEAGIAREDAVVFLCRSGARSKAAAIAMTARGFARCYNLADGFEGPLDDAGHRGAKAGWKAAGLPWTQN
jgi:rhodanese-related sulfurtransferase